MSIKSCGRIVDFSLIKKPKRAPFAFITFSIREEADMGKEYIFSI